MADGTGVGCAVWGGMVGSPGNTVGNEVGTAVGAGDGAGDGSSMFVGILVGCCVGSWVGSWVGAADGAVQTGTKFGVADNPCPVTLPTGRVSGSISCVIAEKAKSPIVTGVWQPKVTNSNLVYMNAP